MQSDEDYEPPSPAGRVMLERNSAHGNEHKHGDDEEDDRSEMAASRLPSKVIFLITLYYILCTRVH